MHSATNGRLPPGLSKGFRLPMIVAPLFLVSSPELVIASCRAGAAAALPSHNARSPEIFAGWLRDIRSALADAPDAAPVAVNLVMHKSNDRLDRDLEICVEHRVPIVIPSVGNPKRAIEAVHGYGGLIISDVGSVEHARRAVAGGVDGLILLCAGAGGHTGWLNPFAFVGEVRRFYDGPLALAGAISRGSHIHAAEVMGADMAVVGTTFCAARESLSPSTYHDMLVESGADDIILTAEVTGLPANMLRKSLERSGFVAGGGRPEFSLEQELKAMTAWRDIWGAGHGVGDIIAVESAAEIIDRFAKDYARSRGGALTSREY